MDTWRNGVVWFAFCEDRGHTIKSVLLKITLFLVPTHELSTEAVATAATTSVSGRPVVPFPLFRHKYTALSHTKVPKWCISDRRNVILERFIDRTIAPNHENRHVNVDVECSEKQTHKNNNKSGSAYSTLYAISINAQAITIKWNERI